MSTTTFGRARKALRIDTAPRRRHSREERQILHLITLKRFPFPKDQAVSDNHPSTRGIESRSYFAQEKRVHDRIIRQLAANPRWIDNEIALRLAQCHPDKPCRNALCWVCKYMFAQAREYAAWNAFRDVPQDGLCLATVLMRIVYGGIREIEAAIASDKAAIRDMIRNMGKIDPKFQRLQWMGYFEIDDYQPADVDLRSRKGKTLRKVKGFDANSDQPLQVIHLHMVVALNGVDKKDLEDCLKRLYPGPWGVEVKGLKKKTSKEANVRRLAAYLVKCHPVYQEATLASDKARSRGNGRYDRVFNDADLKYHARLHAHLGGLGGALKFDRGL